LPTLFIETISCLVLFFARDKLSELKGEQLGINMDVIRDFRDNWSSVKTEFRLQDFPIYGSRLQNIQRSMNEWRPQTIRQLAVRPYKDPVSFYAFWFATVIRIVSILSLAASLAQTYAAFKVF